MAQQNQPNFFFKYSSLVIQMGVIIGLFAWGGQKLDAYLQNRNPVLAIILSLSGIAIGLYLVLRDFIKPKDPSK